MTTSRRQAVPDTRSRVPDLLGLCLFFCGATFLLWLTWQPQTAPVPSAVAGLLRLIAGSGSYAIGIICMFAGTMFLVGYQRFTFSAASAGAMLAFISFTAWRHVFVTGGAPDLAWKPEVLQNAGGYVGAVFGNILIQSMGIVSSYIVFTFAGCISLVLLVDKPFREILEMVHRPAAAGFTAARNGVNTVREKAQTKRLPSGDDENPTVPERAIQPPAEEEPKRRGLLNRLRVKDVPGDGTQLELPIPVTGLPTPKPAPDVIAKAMEREAKQTKNAKSKAGADADPQLDTDLSDTPPNNTFQLPPLTLLRESPPPPANKAAQQELAEKIQAIEQTLQQFDIGANVVEIAHGPTVTRYEVQLAPGIKVSKIVNLADNLAMSLAAIDVRVEAPIPGKAAIGIEVPNSHPTVVSLRECVETDEFQNHPCKLLFALGKDVAGTYKYADITRMPHILIGGSTNSGKSVCLNVLIASILYRATPREVQFIMIDPKRVELSLWDGIPHLMHPVVKDVKQAAGIFRAAIKEMDRRYEMFAKLGTRNLEGYNTQVLEEDKLPYLVIVVDELADLMMQAGAEIEQSICRLAQLARATGIHLVIATQRPSVDVITGLIKANISSRIAFAVASQVDSRTILDATGAERLIGRGDMLYMPIDANKPTRVQGCYLSEQETNALVKYLKEQEKPNYTITPVEVSTGMSGGGGSSDDGDDDELFESAVRLVVNNGHASTSMLQRRFKIGYTRAARLVDIMQERGIVGPLDGAKPREILVHKDEIDRMFLRDILGDDEDEKKDDAPF